MLKWIQWKRINVIDVSVVVIVNVAVIPYPILIGVYLLAWIDWKRVVLVGNIVTIIVSIRIIADTIVVCIKCFRGI